jgi:hypothetical protein
LEAGVPGMQTVAENFMKYRFSAFYSDEQHSDMQQTDA